MESATVEIIIAIAVLLLCGIGIIGCVAPVLPGPPISYAAMLIYHFAAPENKFSLTVLLVSLVFVIIVAAMDYVLPIYTTKKFGGTKHGVWGGIIGLLVGIIILPPWGILVGPLLGAIIGDLVAGKQFESALKSGFGSFVGFLLATLAKLTVCITITVLIIIKMLQVHVF